MLAKYTKILFLLLLLFISKSFIYSQNNLRFSEGWGIGVNIGLNYFFGDISDDKGRIWNNTPLSSFYYTDKNLMASFSLSKSIIMMFSSLIFFRQINLKKSQKDEILPILGKYVFLKQSFTLITE